MAKTQQRDQQHNQRINTMSSRNEHTMDNTEQTNSSSKHTKTHKKLTSNEQ